MTHEEARAKSLTVLYWTDEILRMFPKEDATATAGRVSMEDVVGPCNVKPFRMDEEDMAIVWTDNGEDGSLCLKFCKSCT